MTRFEDNFKETVTEMNCKVFVEAAIIEPKITLLLYIIKIWKFLFPWTLVSSVLKNCCCHEFQGFCGSNNIWASNEVDAYEVGNDVIKIGRFVFVWTLIVSI